MADDVHKTHPVVGKPLGLPPADETKKSSDSASNANNGWAGWTPAKIRQRRGSIHPMLGSAENESDSDSGEDREHAREKARDLDRQLDIMRRVFRKWCRLAKVHGNTCDGLTEGECDIGWTRAIAPRVEGRIRMVGSDPGPATED